MKFLAVSHNMSDPTSFLQAESARTAQLQQTGIFEGVYLKADRSGAVILIAAADADQARAALDTLPLVANGITRFDLTPIVAPPPR
jgi:hypothetical protein